MPSTRTRESSPQPCQVNALVIIYTQGLQKIGDCGVPANTLQHWGGTMGPSLQVQEPKGAPISCSWSTYTPAGAQGALTEWGFQ